MQELESEESETEHVETEDQFLERYAQTARELQEDAVEEAENGQDEDGHEIELGTVVSTCTLGFLFLEPLLHNKVKALFLTLWNKFLCWQQVF